MATFLKRLSAETIQLLSPLNLEGKFGVAYNYELIRNES